MGQSEYRKETVIRYNEEGSMAYIYTCNGELAGRLDAFSRRYPFLCRSRDTGMEGIAYYEIDKSCLSISLSPPCGEGRKAAVREYAKRNGIRVVRGGGDAA